MKLTSYLAVFALAIGLVAGAAPSEFGRELKAPYSHLDIYYIPVTVDTSRALYGEDVMKGAFFKVEIRSSRDMLVQEIQAIIARSSPVARSAFDARWGLVFSNDAGERSSCVGVDGDEDLLCIDGEFAACPPELRLKLGEICAALK